MYRTKFFFILILSLLLNNTDGISQTWKFIKESNGIKIFYREIPNKNLREVKIQTTFKSNLSTIVEALVDVESYPSWVYKAVYSKTIKRLDKNELVYYNKLDFPWPLSDRDVAIHTKVSQNLTTKEVTSISFAEPTALPKNLNYVRIVDFNSKWTFVPKDGYVTGEYTFSSDPGGNIPNWMVNMSLDEGPMKTIQHLKKLMLEKKYSGVNYLAILN